MLVQNVIFLTASIMLDCLFGFFVGTGIGAYKSAQLKPCLNDTLAVAKTKSAPMMGQAKEQVMQLVEKAKAAVSEMRGGVPNGSAR